MDQDEYVLFVDETGTASPKDTNSKYYVLAGCVVKESERVKLKQIASNIKYKYWSDPDIIFHSSEIGRKENSFSIFKVKKVFDDFLVDLEENLFRRDFKLLYVLVDKTQAKVQRWDDKKIYKETSDEMIKSFICFLLAKGAKGKIVIESATASKDFYFLKSLSSFLSQGISSFGISHKSVKEALTSISFVTKNNFDTEEQIADIFAYAARCHYEKNTLKKVFKGDYETLMMKTLSKKLITRAGSAFKKPKYAKHIQSQISIPIKSKNRLAASRSLTGL